MSTLSISTLEDSSDSFMDSCQYIYYDEYFYAIGSSPPLTNKKSRLIAAVVRNQVEILLELLDAPEWYNVRDADGYSLLQIAILRDNREVFDYMLSIPDFPIEYVNKNMDTALVVALDYYTSDYLLMSGHFAYELVRKGACIDVVCYEENTPLHLALERSFSFHRCTVRDYSYYEVALLLIEKGVDVNVVDSRGRAPLEIALYHADDSNDLVCALLMHGAQPSIKIFESSVLLPAPFAAQENLFLYLFDRDRAMHLNLSVVLILAERTPHLFQEIINHPKLRIRTKTKQKYLYYRVLCSMQLDYLEVVIEKIGGCLSAAFAEVAFEDIHYVLGYEQRICLENLNALLGTELKSKIISFISVVDSTKLFENLITGIQDEATITQIYCFLLSYGLNISERDLQSVYISFGYCELFKILLYMDIKPVAEIQDIIGYIMPVFVYDVTMNLESFLANRTLHSLSTLGELFSHFAHPRLKAIYWELQNSSYGILFERVVPNENLPEFPLLQELARNAFRKNLINRLQIKTSCQFHTELNRLPIPEPLKKIITYETKLYYIN